jgi:hypothetical protein
MHETQKWVGCNVFESELVDPMEHVATIFCVIVGQRKWQCFQVTVKETDEIWPEKIVDEDQWPFVDLALLEGWFDEVLHFRFSRPARQL